MSEDLRWAIGLIVTVGVFLVGTIIATFRHLAGRISNGDAELHARINKVREDYVRRADLDGHIQRLDRNVDDLREEIRQSRTETNQRLDTLIAAMTKRHGD